MGKRGVLRGLALLWALAALMMTGMPAVAANGWTCFYCTLITNTVFEYTRTHGNDIGTALGEVCYLLPEEYRATCHELVFVAGPLLINFYVSGSTPDEVCINGLHFCTQPQCLLFPKNSSSAISSRSSDRWAGVGEKVLALFNKLAQTPRVRRSDPISQHLPVVDDDLDRFSSTDDYLFCNSQPLFDEHKTAFPTLRGTSWRGKDCDDQNPNVYPGRKASYLSRNGDDYNCNGINGIDPSSGRPWKDVLCAGSQQLGAIDFGDSAMAHFRIPPEWLQGQYVNSSTYENLVFAAGNELDWPHMSWVTGHIDDPFVDSLYLRLRKLNLCNHRDYQSIAVNGADALKLVGISQTVARNATLDYPAIAVYANIGNDICSQHPDLNHMTSVADYTANVMATLKYLDSGVLPAGSHVLLVGLVDGRFLWDTLHNDMNPIGRPYHDVYAWLACIGINPCWQWLNPNETVRTIASERASQLSNALQLIAQNNTFKNFDTAYIPFPLAYIAQEWEQRGGRAADLIEPVDGFHPSQIGHYLISGWAWDWLQKARPSWIPSPNPNNARIAQLFGDQGGY